MIERKEGPTPQGGVASVIVYVDDQGNETTKEAATRVYISELDAKGDTIAKTIMVRKT